MIRSHQEIANSEIDEEQLNSDQTNDDNDPKVQPKSKKIIRVDIRSSDGTSYHSLGCKCKDEKDYGKAFEWFTKGAEQGCAESTYKIGYFYANGLEVDTDYSKAMEWYLKAAEMGFTKPIVQIGYLYFFGKGVEQDYVEALKWFLKAVEKGSAEAYVSMGNLYSKGTGVERDLSKAMEWYLKAAENGCSTAQFNIGRSYYFGFGVERNYSKAVEWYLKAAENGNTSAQFKVGFLFETGKGIEKNFKKEVFWKSKYFNTDNFTFIEDPYDQFAIQNFTPAGLCDEKEIEEDSIMEEVIIRFEERDFTIVHKYLKSCKYLTTMMNSNWKDFNLKEQNCIVLDLRSVQNQIFQTQENTNHIQIFENYVEYLTNNAIPNDFDMKLKLIELSKYLQDDSCILKIVNQSSILMRLYFLFKFENIEPVHLAIASCFVMGDLFTTMNDLSPNSIETLLNEIELSPMGKKKILDVLVNNKFPNSVIFSK
ncbi:predicted protein [Naegleria gruberi]|uniref:Predicted protein n=1 Tax=Naegleria gruberi TaxID=5762 RepID=D2W485_NAEGR|nr:uncharacterized protein NAEGRDRAFT_76213 [Naegleria gruberi]EFC36113.1 predicted protein [Naegleria gruberi]|eukprot:XP_002668857.1 predicted protein [Naegleria gruberi strain NEG-M]